MTAYPLSLHMGTRAFIPNYVTSLYLVIMSHLFILLLSNYSSDHYKTAQTAFRLQIW